MFFCFFLVFGVYLACSLVMTFPCRYYLLVWLCAFFRYDSPQHIMEEFFTLRMEFYNRRKASLMSKMQSEWSKMDNKVGKPYGHSVPSGVRPACLCYSSICFGKVGHGLPVVIAARLLWSATVLSIPSIPRVRNCCTALVCLGNAARDFIKGKPCTLSALTVCRVISSP